MVAGLALNPPLGAAPRSPRSSATLASVVDKPSKRWPTDPELLRSVLAGDREAEDAFVERYRGLVLGLARSRYGLRDGAAEDLLQETLEALWHDDRRALHAWRGQGRFSTYLTVIVCRLCRRRLASERRRRNLEDESPSVEGIESGEPSADALALDRERLGAVRRELSAMTSRDRLVIAWRFFDGRSPGDFASQLGISAGAARKALHDALRRLRKRLGEAGFAVAETARISEAAAAPTPDETGGDEG